MFNRRLRALTVAGILSGLISTQTFAAENQLPTVPPAPRFDIHAFEVEGNSLLPAADIAAIVKPYTGLSRDFGSVQQALEALQETYLKKGYSAVQVFLPEQELEKGIVRLRVVEQRITSVTVDGNEYYENDNVLRTLPSISEGVIPNMKQVSRSLKVANENPSKQTAILFQNNDDEESVIDATIKVIDDKPWKAFLTADNSGSRETGNGRIGIGYQHYNLFGKDHRVTLQYITNMHWPDGYFNADPRVNILGGAYTIPFYNLGDSLDLIAGYSDVSTGTIAGGAISVTGKGIVLGAHYNHNLDKIGDYDHKLTASIDHHAYRNDVLNDGSGTGLTPHVSATPWGLTYAGAWQKEQKQLSFSLGGSWDLTPNFSGNGSSTTYNSSPYLAERYFSKYNFSVDYIQPFAKTWQIHAALNGQYTNDHLLPGEQFRAGGMDSVRGWHESVASGDKGYRYSIEFISPDFGKVIGETVGLRVVLFMDKAALENNRGVNDSPPDVSVKKSIASMGAGLRYNYARSVVARFDYGIVVDDDYLKNSPSTRRNGDAFGHVSLGFIW